MNQQHVSLLFALLLSLQVAAGKFLEGDNHKNKTADNLNGITKDEHNDHIKNELKLLLEQNVIEEFSKSTDENFDIYCDTLLTENLLKENENSTDENFDKESDTNENSTDENFDKESDTVLSDNSLKEFENSTDENFYILSDTLTDNTLKEFENSTEENFYKVNDTLIENALKEFQNSTNNSIEYVIKNKMEKLISINLKCDKKNCKNIKYKLNNIKTIILTNYFQSTGDNDNLENEVDDVMVVKKPLEFENKFVTVKYEKLFGKADEIKNLLIKKSNFLGRTFGVNVFSGGNNIVQTGSSVMKAVILETVSKAKDLVMETMQQLQRLSGYIITADPLEIPLVITEFLKENGEKLFTLLNKIKNMSEENLKQLGDVLNEEEVRLENALKTISESGRELTKETEEKLQKISESWLMVKENLLGKINEFTEVIKKNIYEILGVLTDVTNKVKAIKDNTKTEMAESLKKSVELLSSKLSALGANVNDTLLEWKTFLLEKIMTTAGSDIIHMFEEVNLIIGEAKNYFQIKITELDKQLNELGENLSTIIGQILLYLSEKVGQVNAIIGEKIKELSEMVINLNEKVRKLKQEIQELIESLLQETREKFETDVLNFGVKEAEQLKLLKENIQKTVAGLKEKMNDLGKEIITSVQKFNKPIGDIMAYLNDKKGLISDEISDKINLLIESYEVTVAQIDTSWNKIRTEISNETEALKMLIKTILNQIQKGISELIA